MTFYAFRCSMDGQKDLCLLGKCRSLLMLAPKKVGERGVPQNVEKNEGSGRR